MLVLVSAEEPGYHGEDPILRQLELPPLEQDGEQHHQGAHEDLHGVEGYGGEDPQPHRHAQQAGEEQNGHRPVVDGLLDPHRQEPVQRQSHCEHGGYHGLLGEENQGQGHGHQGAAEAQDALEQTRAEHHSHEQDNQHTTITRVNKVRPTRVRFSAE